MICSNPSSSTTEPHAQRVSCRGGSTLVWVMVVILVLVIVLGVGLAAASGNFNLSATRHKQQQAYYTALSSTQTVADWLVSNSESDAAKSLLAQLENDDDATITIVADDLPAAVGNCVVELSYVDVERNTLKISSTATFADISETVSLTLTKGGGSLGPFEGELKVADFTTTAYDANAAKLNAFESGGIVPLYEANDNNNSTFNAADLKLLDTLIPNENSTLEARWTNSCVTSSSTANDDNMLGTQKRPLGSNSAIDTRRFVVPKNGRITIDPLETDGYQATLGNPNDEATEPNNTRIVSLAIDNTAGKDVAFRLASGSSATSSKLTLPSATLFKDLYGTSSPYEYSDTKFYDRSAPRYASLLMLNFTDNAGNTEDLKFEVNGVTRTYTWHPNNWDSLDLFVQDDAGVTSNLVIGPFGHKYDIVFDYYSWGNFVDNWHGKTAGEAEPLWPGVPNGHTSKFGIPVFPVDFGKDASFWILDGRGDRYFRVTQGANIIKGSIYSTRSTIIGGALIRSSSAHTTDGLNRSLDGFADLDASNHITYVASTSRYSQLIYNTNIVLKAPSTGTAASEIRRPQTWRDRSDDAGKVTATDKTFEPTMTIKGGTIYVGERQSLTIQGAVLDNMWISPDKIVVAAGGTLTIKKSSYLNVLTDIYVDGGTLVIEADAKIKGNIYVYNGGTVNPKGGFLLESPHSEADEQEHDGILVYGTDTVGTNGITAPGLFLTTLTLNAFQDSKGDALPTGKVHLIGGDWDDLVEGALPSIGPGSAFVKLFLCGDYDPITGRCQHYGKGGGSGGGGGGGGSGGSGGWVIGSFGDG